MPSNRRSRQLRHNGLFQPTDPGLVDIRRLLFGDRFKAGFGLKDPAYMPLTAHEAAEYLFTQGVTMWDKHHSAEELEGWIEGAPDIDQLGPVKQTESYYDDAARLTAKWVLQRLRGVPADMQLAVTFWEVMESAYPRMRDLMLSTAQKQWARSAAMRVIDAYRADGEIDA